MNNDIQQIISILKIHMFKKELCKYVGIKNK